MKPKNLKDVPMSAIPLESLKCHLGWVASAVLFGMLVALVFFTIFTALFWKKYGIFAKIKAYRMRRGQGPAYDKMEGRADDMEWDDKDLNIT